MRGLLLLLLVSSGLAAQPFATVKPGYPFSFPRDHFLHPEFSTEWWYVTANLRDGQGNHYGIQYTLFAAADTVADKVHRIYFAHATLSTEDEFYYAERFAREDMQHAGIDRNPWRAYIDHWSFEGAGDEPLPGTIQVQQPDFGYALKASASLLFLQGENGFSRKDSAGTMASYYYSMPFIELRGTLNIEGREVEVEGHGWLDREWSSNVVRTQNLGWDWFSLQLDPSTALMLYRVRSQSDNYLYATLMNKDGTQKILPADKVTLRGSKMKEFDNQQYAMRWEISIPDEGIDITTKPINENQYLRTRSRYWEGAVLFSGTHQGSGYIELVGRRQSD